MNAACTATKPCSQPAACAGRSSLFAPVAATVAWAGVAGVDRLVMPETVQTARDLGVVLPVVSRWTIDFHSRILAIGGWLLPAIVILTLFAGLIIRKLVPRMTAVLMCLWCLAGATILGGMILTAATVSNAGAPIAP